MGKSEHFQKEAPAGLEDPRQAADISGTQREGPARVSAICQVPARERGPAMLPAVCKVPGHVFGPTLVISELSSRSQKPHETMGTLARI